jgi:hypothetical protein
MLQGGVVVGRIFCLDAVGPQGRPWMWASGHSAATVKRAAHDYEPTSEAAMSVAKSSERPRLGQLAPSLRLLPRQPSSASAQLPRASVVFRMSLQRSRLACGTLRLVFETHRPSMSSSASPSNMR